MDNLSAHNASDYDQQVRRTIPFYDLIHKEIIRLVKTVQPNGSAWVETGCAIQCHHYLQPDGRREAVQACFDLLAQGALFVTFENAAFRTTEGTRIALKRWKAFQMEEGRPEQDADMQLTRYGTRFFPITVNQQLELLTQTGFRVAELFWLAQLQSGFYGIK